MKNHTKMILAVACLTLPVLACQAVTGGGTSDTPVAPVDTNVPAVPTDPAPSTGDVILSDDFSKERWGTGEDTNRVVQYTNKALQIKVFTENYFVWSSPNDDDYENVHLEVTVNNNGTDPTTAFGLMCHQQVTDSGYYFAITPAGQYAIAISTLTQSDVFLTNNDEWASSELIADDASSYRIGADCGNGRLTLYVDGQQVDSVSDSSYTSGGVAVFAWSGEDANSADVSFDDFLLTELP